MSDQISMLFIFQHIGLIRQYFPKGTDFGEIKDNRIQEIGNKLNLWPRKRLEHKVAIEVFIQWNTLAGSWIVDVALIG